VRQKSGDGSAPESSRWLRGGLSFELIAGEAVRTWLRAIENRQAWRRLYDACPWSTVFQSPGFFDIWLRHYGEWSPLIILARREGEDLAGLMPLAVRGREITGAGAHQADYHGWICAPDEAEAFADGALFGFAQELAGHALRLRYLPRGLSEGLVRRLAKRNSRITLHRVACDVFTLDERMIWRPLNKRGNKSKVRRLQRFGKFSLQTLSASAFAATLDRIAAMYDFRQGAINGVCPFLDDPSKAAFHRDWIRTEPRQVYASALYLGDHLVAALIFAASKAEVHLAISAHAPEFAANSPSKIHMYETGLALLHSGCRTIDLTPGGDPWKARFPSERTAAWELKLHATTQSAALSRLRARARSLATSTLAGTVQGWLRRAARDAWTSCRALIPLREKLLRLDLAVASHTENGANVAPNDLGLLARWGPAMSRKPRQAFLQVALARIEAGGQCHTIERDGVLRCLGWALKQRDRFMLRDFAFASDIDRATLHVLLRQMTLAVKRAGGQSELFLSAPAIQRTLIDAALDVGFSNAK